MRHLGFKFVVGKWGSKYWYRDLTERSVVALKRGRDEAAIITTSLQTFVKRLDSKACS